MTIYPRIVKIFCKMIFTPKYVDLRVLSSIVASRIYAFFVVKSTRVSRLGGGGSSQSWQCQDFHGFCSRHPSLRVGIYSRFRPWVFKWGNKCGNFNVNPTTFKFDKEYSISTCRPITLKIGNYSEFQLAHQWKYSRATALTTNFVSQWKINGKPAC